MNLSEAMDSLFASGGSSANDPRFEYDVGTHVIVDEKWMGQIVSRRNGYPPPYFNCWFPIYFVQPFEGEPTPFPGGEDVGPARVKPIP